MGELNLERLIKLLNLTSSPADNEALLAVRLANKMLADSNRSWISLIQVCSPAKDRDDEIRAMFDWLNSQTLPEKTIKFLAGLETFFSSKGFLSPRQFSSLRRTYLKHGGNL